VVPDDDGVVAVAELVVLGKAIFEGVRAYISVAVVSPEALSAKAICASAWGAMLLTVSNGIDP